MHRRTPSLKKGKPRVSGSSSVPAPVGGWNARDPLANMAVSDAIILDNWFPRTADVEFRKGSIDWATGLPSQVNSLLPYNGATVSSLFAASGANIYDVTTQGAVGAPVYTGLTSTKFNFVNFVNAGGNFLWAVNGADLALLYNGTTWTNPVLTGIGSLTTADFTQITVWKHRIFLVEENSMSVWYLGIDAVSGAASEINFGPLFKKGGKIVAIANWTIDGGYGMDDQFVIITSRGEVAVYRGTDPSNASDFLLVGVYELGAPVSDKCFVKFAGDLVLMTLDGFIPLSKALTSTRIDQSIAISNKISGALSEATALYKDNFGWHPLFFPKEDMLLFNVPVSVGMTSHQYVMNPLTGAWCRFKGWNANCFELHNDDMYFGTMGKVCKAWSGTSDSGAGITAEVKTAFNYFGSMGQNKQWKMARPIFISDEVPNPLFGLNVDFQDADITTSTTISSPAGVWDVGLWDLALWGGNTIYKSWQSIQGIGFCAALRIKITSTSISMTWASTDYVYEAGGII